MQEGKPDALIVGAGVAGLEATFALHDLAGELLRLTVLAPEGEYTHRLRPSGESFSSRAPAPYRLAGLLSPAGAALVQDAFRWLDPVERVVHTKGGQALSYDLLLLTLGARRRPPLRYVLTLDERRLGEQLDAVLEGVESGSIRRLALVVGGAAGWSLPMYELGLLIARRAREVGARLEITLATAESAPVEVFGPQVSQAVAELLDETGIRVVAGVRCAVPAPGVVSLRPGGVELEVDQVIALPHLYGPSTPGVPKRARGGFLSVDPHGRVRDVWAVWAAGDATDFPVKNAAIAAQQADAAAASMAAAAGADLEPAPLAPVIHGALVGGNRPLAMTTYLLGPRGHRSELSTTIAPRPLGEYLEAHLGQLLSSGRQAR